MSIPVDIAHALLPNSRDHVLLSHIYTPIHPDAETETTVTYKIPLIQNITWTHIRPYWTGENTVHFTLVYENPTTHSSITLPFATTITEGTYQQFEWPIPPAPLDQGAYLALILTTTPAIIKGATLRIKVIGFEDILPENASEYIYEGKSHSTEWAFRLNSATNRYTLFYPTTSITTFPVIIPSSMELLLAAVP